MPLFSRALDWKRRVAKKRAYWLCAGCSRRNERAHIKCRTEGCNRTRPKKRVPKHAEILRDKSYNEGWPELSVEIHGGQLHACGVCGRMPNKLRNHDRDHDHDTGKPRGIACPGRYGCNMFMPQGLTAARAQQIADYLKRVEEFYAHQTEGANLGATGDGK